MELKDLKKIQVNDLVGIQFDDVVGLTYGIVINVLEKIQDKRKNSFVILFQGNVAQHISGDIIVENKRNVWRIIAKGLNK